LYFQAGNFLEELRKVAAIIIDRTICFRKIATLFFWAAIALTRRQGLCYAFLPHLMRDSATRGMTWN